MHIAVVGGGYWGSKHLRVLAGLASIDQVTLVEVDPRRREALGAAFPQVRTTADLDGVLSDLDGVVVATRAGSHVSLGLKAIRAGVNVLVEKPLATSLADATLLCEEAERHGVVLMTGHTFEFNPAVLELKRRVESGELGRLQYIRAQRLNLGLYQNDVNVIWDLGPHDVSIINYLLDSAPAVVTAWGHHSAGHTYEDVGMVRLEYPESDIEAYVHLSWLDPAKVREVTVVGSQKMAVYDDVNAEERLRLYDRGVERPALNLHEVPMSYRYGDITSPFIQFEEPLVLEDSCFVDGIRTGRVPRADGWSGRRVVAVLEAAQRSLEQGRPVSLAELDPVADRSVAAVAGGA